MHSWNLLEWMKALGIKRKEEPDLLHVVQPVSIVGDHSAFAAPLLPPMAWTGARVAAAGAGTYGCLSLTSAAAGGTFIRWLEWLTAAGGYFGWSIDATPAAMANLVAGINKYDMGQAPTSSVLVMGTIAVPAFTVTGPVAEQAANPSKSWPDFCYIPPGSTLQMWMMTANQEQGCAIMFEDCPAQLAER